MRTGTHKHFEFSDIFAISEGCGKVLLFWAPPSLCWATDLIGFLTPEQVILS